MSTGGRLYPRRFALVRHIDYTGVSGIGVVAYGVVFFDGQVAMRWCSDHPATSLWSSIDDVLAVHGHGDGTSVQWIDDVSDRLQEAMEPSSVPRGRRARRSSSGERGEIPVRVETSDVRAEATEAPPRAEEPPDESPAPAEPPPSAEDAAPAPPPPPVGDTLPPWAPTNAPDADEQIVPSQRRSGGRHRRHAEPSEESAVRR